MPSPLTQRPPPPSKKQQSIASFFTPKPSTPTTQQSSVSGLSVDKASTAQLVPQHETGEAFVDENEPKRVKRKVPDEQLGSPFFKKAKPASQSPRRVSSPTAATVADRTARFFFSGESHFGNDDSMYDDETLRQHALLHEKFVRKLGRPDSIANIKRRNHVLAEDQRPEEAAEEGSDVDSQEDEERPAKKQKFQASAARRSKDKLTPLEHQVIDIKRTHADTLLVVEVGYKFRFFGEDARTAAKELSIVCIPGKYRFDEHPSEAHLHRFASASIPVHRLHVHVKRLVSAGHKVGVVRQLETAALKAAGSNRNTAFQRGITNIYTKGTYIDDHEGLDQAAAEGGEQSLGSGHLLCLTETFPKGWGTDERVHIGYVAVQPSTGDIIYDDFEDGWMRSELETRLLHIAPCEILLVGELTKATEKLISHLTSSKSNVLGDKARIERVDKSKTMAAQAYDHLTKFYADKLRADTPILDSTAPPDLDGVRAINADAGALLDKVHTLSENASICLSAMIKHLTEYKLEHVFDLTKNFKSFSARSHMLVNANTLNSLEIYRNQTDLTSDGSLFWVLDRTQTRFGQRLLRNWVGRPLLDHDRLLERLAAVEELSIAHNSPASTRIHTLLGRVRGDLERSLIRIYYGKCTRPELLMVLQTLQMIAQEYSHVDSAESTGFRSSLIAEALACLPRILDEVVSYLERMNAEAAKQDDKYNFFRDKYETEDITNHKVGIVAVEHDLEQFRQIAAEELKRKRVDYITVAAIEYLIELDNTSLKNVPASWIKISGTKKVSRYHAPEVLKLMKERDQHKEALANACDSAFAGLLTEIGSQYQAFRECIKALAQLDCLLSLAEIARQPGYCKPQFKSTPGISISGCRHPMVEQMLLNTYVPNDVELDATRTRALLVTGPNMGGKSSYVRSVALTVIMAQIGSFVPAASATLSLCDAVFTRMGAFDNMMKGESTFMVELSETADILKQATPRSLVVIDELGRGTSTYDGCAIADAVLDYMLTQLKSLTLFITHYQSMTRLAERYPEALRNVHMRFSEAIDGSGEQEITFLYEVGDGVAHRSYGLNVARLAGLPKSLITEASQESKRMEQDEARRRLAYLSVLCNTLLTTSQLKDLEYIVEGIEQL